MGEMADLEIDQAILHYDLGEDTSVEMFEPEEEWRTRDGRVIKLRNMTTAHLQRTLAMLLDLGTAFEHPSIAPMKAELRRRKRSGDLLFQNTFSGLKRGVFGRTKVTQHPPKEIT